MVKVHPNKPFQAIVPEGCQVVDHGGGSYIPPLAVHLYCRYANRVLTRDKWGKVLRKMGYHCHRIAAVKSELAVRYPNPLGYDEWHHLVEQLAIDHLVATQYPSLR
jgi:hypothetical protein